MFIAAVQNRPVSVVQSFVPHAQALGFCKEPPELAHTGPTLHLPSNVWQ